MIAEMKKLLAAKFYGYTSKRLAGAGEESVEDLRANTGFLKLLGKDGTT